MQNDEGGDKRGRNALEIAAEFRHRHVTTQIHFVNTFERAQVVSDISPHAFGGIGVNFSNTISIIVMCPFVFGMANGCVLSKDVVVRRPFIGVSAGLLQGKAMNMGFQCFTVCMVNDS